MIDKDVNIAQALEIVDKFNSSLPHGMYLYTTTTAFGVHYRPPNQCSLAPVSMQVWFNLPKLEFIKACNDVCDHTFRLAKAMNTNYGVSLVKSSRVIECEKTMKDGKCQCGYSLNQSESAQALRNIVKPTQHSGSNVKVISGRLNEDGDVVW